MEGVFFFGRPSAIRSATMYVPTPVGGTLVIKRIPTGVSTSHHLARLDPDTADAVFSSLGLNPEEPQ